MSTESESSPEIHNINEPVTHYRLSYPLDAKQIHNPLKLLQASDWHPKYSTFSNINDFYSEYKIDKILKNENSEYTIFRIRPTDQNRFELVKVYDLLSNSSNFKQCYQHIVFIRETVLMEYYQTYYDPKYERIFIRQPIYSKSLYEQINENKFAFNNEKAIKHIIAEILDKIWNIHNCGFIHGNIHPNNIVKREFNDNNEFINDGWKLINFENIKKYKSDGEYIGTVGWSSPEMNICVSKSKQNKYLYSSDIFSFGLVILFILFGEQPLDITEEEKTKYGLNCDLFKINDGIDNKKRQQFKQDLKSKMCRKWYFDKLLKSENMIRNYLIKLYYHNKISMSLFELLYGMLDYDPEKRWNCQQIYNSQWCADIRRIDNKKKVKKLRIKLHV